MSFIGHAMRNMVVLAPDEGTGRRRLRILEIRRDAGQAAMFDIDDPTAWPFWVAVGEVELRIAAGDMEVLDEPRLATIRRDSDLTGSERRTRDWRWDAIRPIVEGPDRADLDTSERQAWIRWRAQELQEAKRELEGPEARGPRADKLVIYLRLFWAGGQVPNTLVPRYLARGAPGTDRTPAAGSPKVGRHLHQSGPEPSVGIPVTEDILEKLQTVGVRLRKKRGWSDMEAFDEFTDLYFTIQVKKNGVTTRVRLPADQRISHRQFIYHTNKVLSRLDKFVAQKGAVAVAQRHRARTGNTAHLHFGPGSVYQIDATVADVYLRSRHDPKRLVGRPVVYIVIDMYTRMIVGFAVALHGPSWEVAAAAIENAFSDKVAYCQGLGISIAPEEWPARHQCKGLMGDRGWDHLSKHAGASQDVFGYKLSNLPPYRADLKGLVENQFNFLKAAVKFVPGDWRERPKGERPNELDGAMTLREFEKFLALKILRRNATLQIPDPPQDWEGAGLGLPTPNMLWAHGVKAFGSPELPRLEQVRQGRLTVGEARTSAQGLMFRSVQYVPEEAEGPRIDDLLRFPGKRWKNVEIRYSEVNASSVLVPVERGARMIRYVLPRKSRFEGWTFDEVDEWHAARTAGRRKAEDRDAEVDARWKAEISSHLQEVRASGSDEVDRTRRPKADADARRQEALEDRVSRAERALAPSEDGDGPDPAPVTEDTAPRPPPQAGLRPNRMDILIRAREEALPGRTE